MLHAAAGDYAKARAELEESLRLNPNYATAHENLGDVYAMLAAESYARAQQAGAGQAPACRASSSWCASSPDRKRGRLAASGAGREREYLTLEDTLTWRP